MIKLFSQTKIILLIPGMALLAACVAAPQQAVEMGTPSYQRLQFPVAHFEDGAIYEAGTELVLYEDYKARRVGDILTVFLVEETSGQNSFDNNINQSTDMSIGTPTFGGTARPNFGVELGSENSFVGQSGTSQSNSLNGSITVTVHGIMPNGNLIVEGEKWVNINQAHEYVKLQGVVRPRDIGAYNTIYSTQVADARISYGGRGTNAQSNSPGWAARILLNPIWPF